VAEEKSGLSYTIKFVADTTEIDKSIKDIATKVEKEVKEAIQNAKIAAGVVDEDKPESAAPSTVDKIINEFKEVKERITGMIQRFASFAGEAIGLRHPTDKTMGAIAARTAEKLRTTKPEGLPLDTLLQVTGGVSVMSERLKAIRELRPELSPDEAVRAASEEFIATLKGSATGGLKHAATVTGWDRIIGQWADFFKRGVEQAGIARPKGTEKGFMESVTHDMIAEIGKTILRSDRPSAAWEKEEVSWGALYRRFGIDDTQQLQQWNVPTRARAADFVRIFPDIVEMAEFGGAKEAGKFIADAEELRKFIQRLTTVPEMKAKWKEEFGKEPTDVKAIARLLSGGEFGDVRTRVAGIPLGAELQEAEFRDIGSQVQEVMRQSLIQGLEGFDQYLRTNLSALTEPSAREYIENLLEIISTGLEELKARSLPPLWEKIGVRGWIYDASEAYVGLVAQSISPALRDLFAVELDKLQVDTGEVATAEMTPVDLSGIRSDLGKILKLLGDIDSPADFHPGSNGAGITSVLDQMRVNKHG
jgi:hypothetical protein